MSDGVYFGLPDGFDDIDEEDDDAMLETATLGQTTENPTPDETTPHDGSDPGDDESRIRQTLKDLPDEPASD